MTAQNLKDTRVTLTIGNIILFIMNAILATSLVTGYKGKIDSNTQSVEKLQKEQTSIRGDFRAHEKEEDKKTFDMFNRQSVTEAKLDYIIKQLDKR